MAYKHNIKYKLKRRNKKMKLYDTGVYLLNGKEIVADNGEAES